MAISALSHINDSRPTINNTESWQSALRNAIRDPIELCKAVQLSPEYQQPAVQAAEDFPVFAPTSFVAKMEKGNPNDPLLRQVLPLCEELAEADGYTRDPVGDRPAIVQPGLIQKYRGRVLLVTTGACPVHCRYCFRRHYPYQGGPRSIETWQDALNQIEADPSVEEVILSGGDPLTLVDSELAELVWHLSRIGHLRRLRIHTRFPIMVPQRINDELLSWLAESRLSSVVVIHANHPAELDDAVAGAASQLIAAGASLLNQSVLLRGVNDNADTLAELSQRLVDLRVMPYYLHQLDRVSGASHFEVPVAVGKQIITQLRARLPGYAVPRYVREDAGATSKTTLL
jgi:EF-P beta-lysylation protein EpmB